MTSKFEPHIDDNGISRVEVSFDSPLTVPQFLKWLNTVEQQFSASILKIPETAHHHELIEVPFVRKGEVVSVVHCCLYCPYTEKRQKV